MARFKNTKLVKCQKNKSKRMSVIHFILCVIGWCRH